MRFTKKKIVGVVATTAVIALGAGAAVAYWTTSGTGTGSAAVGDVVGITVVQTSSVTAMYPGSAPQALAGTLTNTNAGPVTISAVTAAVDSVTDGFTDEDKPECLPGDFDITGTAPIITPVLANDTSTWSGLSIQLLNTASNQDNCKNATAEIEYTKTP